ncbi:hypothetical protein BKA60DRAFT_576795 [Fusarium oxysporum]|nr:hypothetical protein BKA60DRAFT_576795 [Fusarium oxysporum]
MSSSISGMDSISILPLDAGDTGPGPKRGRRPLEVPEGGSVTNVSTPLLDISA